MRLANVEAEAARTQAGRAAAQEVRARLARAGAVVVKTQRLSDAHGPYVGHVFCSGDAEASPEAVFKRGAYLNGEMVKWGAGFQAAVALNG